MTRTRIPAAIAAAIVAAALAGGLTACGTATPAKPAASTSAPAPASQPAAAPAPAAPSPKDQVLTWWAATGQHDNGIIKADLAQMSADAGNTNVPAVEKDGARLQANAQAALDDAPASPAGFAGPYETALRDYRDAGGYLADGDITDATAALTQGNSSLATATDYLNSLAG